MSGNTWPSFGATQVPQELLDTTEILELSPEPKKGHRTSDAKPDRQNNGISTSAKRSSSSDIHPSSNSTKRRRYPVKPKVSRPKMPPSKSPQLGSPLAIIPRPIRPKTNPTHPVNQQSLLLQNMISTAVGDTMTEVSSSSSAAWKKNIVFTDGESQIHVRRGEKPFYIKKCGYKYVYYYDSAHPAAVYLVGNLTRRELEILQRCSSSASSYVLGVLAYDSIGQILVDGFRAQDLNQIYSFAELGEEVIWYIARELLEGINFLHGLDIALNTMNCYWIMITISGSRCLVQIE
ncbi:hypothetical protein TWF594_007851 [Orbilia oligospora]|nr:hypothetical protein TWF594_007851 [Orbilia oligospora]